MTMEDRLCRAYPTEQGLLQGGLVLTEPAPWLCFSWRLLGDALTWSEAVHWHTGYEISWEAQAKVSNHLGPAWGPWH